MNIFKSNMMSTSKAASVVNIEHRTKNNNWLTLHHYHYPPPLQLHMNTQVWSAVMLWSFSSDSAKNTMIIMMIGKTVGGCAKSSFASVWSHGTYNSTQPYRGCTYLTVIATHTQEMVMPSHLDSALGIVVVVVSYLFLTGLTKKTGLTTTANNRFDLSPFAITTQLK